MKLIIQIIVYLILTYISWTEEAVGQTSAKRINYTCRYNTMFGRGINNKSYHASLVIHDEQSIFTMKADADNKQDSHLVMVDLEPDSMFTVFKDQESNSLIFEMNGLNQHPVYYADTLYPMHWEYINEEKSISNTLCKKARTEFKGRIYYAWYAPSIQIPNGPWKLGGLPGLILEAYDDEDYWHIQYQSSEALPAVHFERFHTLMHGNIPDYQGYVGEVKKIFKRASQYLASQQSGNCLSCQTKSTLKMFSWEAVD